MSKLSVDSENRIIITEKVAKEEPLFSSDNPVGKAKAIYETVTYNLGMKKTLEKTVLEGKWYLRDDYTLAFTVSDTNSAYTGRTIIFNGEIQNVAGSTMSFRVRGSEALSGVKSTTIQLKGIWQADKYNRITFLVSKKEASTDVLTFEGKWKVNKNNEVVIRHKKTYLKKGAKNYNEIIFRGFWEFHKNKIVYKIEKNDNSYFAFNAELVTKDLTFKDKTIKYKVGIKYVRKNVHKTLEEIVAIHGEWKVNKDLKIFFEISFSGIKKQNVLFGIEKLIKQDEKISVVLETAEGEKLGIKFMFSKTFRNDAELFISLARYPKETRVEGGLRVRF